jgi:hypothetical protein
MKPQLICVTVWAILLASCAGSKCLSGTVIAETTGAPIAGAEITVKSPQRAVTKTDSLGKFIIYSGFTSMMFGGPRFVFEIKKEEYIPQKIKKGRGDITITLREKINRN